VGEYDIDDISIGNDVISSVKVPDGMLVILYQNRGFQGEALGLDQNDNNLSDKGFNDQASSIVVHSESEFKDRLQKKEVSPYNIGDPPLLTSFAPPSTDIQPKLVGETLLPFIYVSEEGLDAELQSKENPYYILSRDLNWKLLNFYTHSGEQDKAYTIKKVTGVEKSTEKSIKQTLGWEISATGGFAGDLFSGGMSAKLSGELETTFRQKETVSEEVEVVETVELPRGKKVTLAYWQMVDRYTLKRLDGSLVREWPVNFDFFYEDAYPELTV
jgi:hypothetical protein